MGIQGIVTVGVRVRTALRLVALIVQSFHSGGRPLDASSTTAVLSMTRPMLGVFLLPLSEGEEASYHPVQCRAEPEIETILGKMDRAAYVFLE
jgi:hypothetical protein